MPKTRSASASKITTEISTKISPLPSRFAAVALAACAILAAGACSKNKGKAGKQSSSGDASQVVAKVDDSTITVGDVQERINKRGFPRGLKFLPIAGLWNPTSKTDPFFLPLEKGYLDSIASV